MDNVSNLTKLGSNTTTYKYDTPDKNLLEVFENQFPKRDYVTSYIFNEFSSLCPVTKQPDFATITVKYIANELCIETKSLKLYFLSYRQYGSFMETITNQILEDCIAACSPKYMKVTAKFNVRGGTAINVVAKFGSK
jgi:7-cyano-7-deazaguanine reductase